MMEVRRKFFAGTISVLSLEVHSSFMRLERWSREELAAIVTAELTDRSWIAERRFAKVQGV